MSTFRFIKSIPFSITLKFYFLFYFYFNFFKMYFINRYVWMFVCMHICITHVRLVPVEPRRELQRPWIYRWLKAAKKVLGIEARSFRRVVSALNCWAISLILIIKNLKKCSWGRSHFSVFQAGSNLQESSRCTAEVDIINKTAV